MTKWNYFWYGIQFGVLFLELFFLIFGEVTIWPMKQPLYRHLVLYPIAILLVMCALVGIVVEICR